MAKPVALKKLTEKYKENQKKIGKSVDGLKASIAKLKAALVSAKTAKEEWKKEAD